MDRDRNKEKQVNKGLPINDVIKSKQYFCFDPDTDRDGKKDVIITAMVLITVKWFISLLT